MNKEVLETLGQIRNMAMELLHEIESKTNLEGVNIRIKGMSDIIDNLKLIIPNKVYAEYSDFFDAFSIFCSQCGNMNFLMQEVSNMKSSLILFMECMENIEEECVRKVKKCICCGRNIEYLPLPSSYEKKRIELGINYQSKSETLNKNEYLCPYCGASDRDRLIISYLEKEKLQEATEGSKLLQFAPSEAISKWIMLHCPQIVYETADLFMDNVTYNVDIMDMNIIPDETYDVIICSHVLEHVKDDRKALREMKRILKSTGKIVFLVPVDLNMTCIDEEWGLPEEENWKRFGQGDHCRKYDKKGLLERLGEQFVVHSLGKEYFGEDLFFQCGLLDTSTLYVMTKADDVTINMGEVVRIDEELCIEGPLVSVILPCYNHEQFVAEAIESVINQSYKNIEILVADDASTDNTATIMKQYSSHFAKEFYFTKNAGGRGKFLQQYAKGKYIALMHSDDIWDKNKLALQVAYMEKHEECGACLTWCMYTNEKLEELDDYIFIKGNRNRYEWMRFFWEKGNALCNPSSLTRREVAMKTQKYGGACRQLPDFFKWIDIIQHTSIYVVPKILTKMRRHQKEGSENTSAISHENIIRHSIEEGCNWLAVIRDMDLDFFINSFKDLMIHPQENSEIGIKCEKYFLMLNHQNMFVQNSAMCYFSEIYNEVKDYMEKEYDYTRKNLANDVVKKGIAQLIKME